MASLNYVDSGAELSECGRYRWRLWRRWWDLNGKTCLWIMLNPSTADGREDDPTIRKCVGFGQRWGYGAIEVVNLFAWRATQPTDLFEVLRKNERDPGVEPDPSGGAKNQEIIQAAVARSDMIMAAWGAKITKAQARRLVPRELVRTLRLPGESVCDLSCLGATLTGSPKHPLYVSYETTPERYVL